MKYESPIINNISNLYYYISEYTKVKIDLELDTDKNTLRFDRVLNKNIYTNTFEDVIYLSNVQSNVLVNNLALKQEDKIYFIYDTRDDLDILIPTNKKVFIYKDFEILNLLSDVKETVYTFQDSRLFDTYTVLEVRFNGKKLNHFSFDGTLKKLNVGGNVLPYQYLNNIQVILAKPITNKNDIEVFVEHIDHTKFDDTKPFKDIEDKYMDISKVVNDFNFRRNLFDTFTYNPIRNDKAYHQVSKNFRTEANLKVYNSGLETLGSLYGSGLYGSGLYGVGKPTLSNILQNGKRFRFIFHNDMTGELVMINNCKSRNNFEREINTTNNVFNYTIDGDRELVFNIAMETSGYKFYKVCFN